MEYSLSEITPKDLLEIAAKRMRRAAHEEAAAIIAATLELDPENHTALLLLGECHMRAGRVSAAIGCFRRGLEQSPDDTDVLAALAKAYGEAGQFEEAADLHAHLTKLDASNPHSLHAQALALRRAGRMEDALPYLDAAIEINPADPNTHFTRATTHLALGHLAQGWREFDARRDMTDTQPRSNLPLWDGKPAPDARLVVIAEGGHGDIIWAARFLDAVRPKVGRLELVLPTSLHKILADVDGVDQIHSSVSEANFDLYCPLLSLPVRLNVTDPRAFPPAKLSPASSSSKIAPLIAHARGRKRVGIIWSGNERYAENHERAAPLEAFLPLAERANVQLYSLQKGPQQLVLRDEGYGNLIVETDDFDFAETAALIKELDLVIMTDTAACHIAGSLGAETWLLLHTAPFWLWGMSGQATDWYPSLRLFRQTRPRDWPGVIQEVLVNL